VREQPVRRQAALRGRGAEHPEDPGPAGHHLLQGQDARVVLLGLKSRHARAALALHHLQTTPDLPRARVDEAGCGALHLQGCGPHVPRS